MKNERMERNMHKRYTIYIMDRAVILSWFTIQTIPTIRKTSNLANCIRDTGSAIHFPICPSISHSIRDPAVYSMLRYENDISAPGMNVGKIEL